MTSDAYIFLASGWVAWCSLHSLLISKTVSGYLQKMMGEYKFYYRLAYNLIALLSLIPLLLITESMRTETIFTWQGGWVILRLLMFVVSIWLFVDGARSYDLSCMLGFKQIKNQRQNMLIAEDEQFSRKGVLGITRHPWYLGGLLIIWSRYDVYHDSTFIAFSILSFYLIVGSWLEEQKLVAEYGEKYSSYQQDVSMLIPWKWLVGKYRKVSR